MRDKLLRKSAVTWIVGILAVVLLSTVLMAVVGGGAGDTSGLNKILWFFQGLDEHGLPAQSRYEMITYDSYTVTQNEFPLYYEKYDDSALLGTVTTYGKSVHFDIGDHVLPREEEVDGRSAAGNGSLPDRFVGYKDSLQQLTDAGYSDFFVICYENGNYFMAGVKDGKIGVLPMWERMKGMEYLYSHFLEPMPIAEAEKAMDLWREYYAGDPNVLYNPSLHPNMMFEDAPEECWMFSPMKGTGSAAYHEPGWYHLSGQ